MPRCVWSDPIKPAKARFGGEARISLARRPVSRGDVADAWRTVGDTEEVRAVGVVVRYWWRRYRLERARHAPDATTAPPREDADACPAVTVPTGSQRP